MDNNATTLYITHFKRFSLLFYKILAKNFMDDDIRLTTPIRNYE